MLREFGVSAEARGKEDEFLLPRTAEYCRMFGFPLNEEPPALGGYVHDGDLIKIGNIELKALAVPGHSPGSMVFYCEAQHCMFSGDVLFRGSIGRADLEGGNFDQLRESIVARLLTLPDETMVYPGHGNPTTIGYEKMNNPFFRYALFFCLKTINLTLIIMKTTTFANRHIGIGEEELPLMLKKIGVSSLDELIEKTIPTNILLKEPLKLGAAMTEREFAEHIGKLAAQTKLYKTYIGCGWYDTVTPAVVQRNVFENPVWYTSYTPYQAEISQGRLEALLNFQTVISDPTALPLANCSLLDEATAAAEAATMMYGLEAVHNRKRRPTCCL